MIELSRALEQLPIYPLSDIRQEFLGAIAQTPLLLEAEPGAGKSTLAPLWVLGQLGHEKQVILVQPRILAAQSLAQRLADLIQEPLGQTVGYQVAYDNCLTAKTRLMVVTPGILLQKLLNDPELKNVDAIILDEIHERSLQQDLLWALLSDLKVLRDELQLVFMSATPDAQLKLRTEQVFNARSLFVAGRCFPVQTHYSPALVDSKLHYKQTESIDRHLIRALNNLAGWQEKTILVFLPGWYEIETSAQRIAEVFPTHPVFRLHSRVANLEQKKALDAQFGPRIILSTNIAETSLTIEDVSCVIDSGLANKVEFEQRTGLTSLKKTRISQASAEQRRGRAGRMRAGECIRLWNADLHLAPADLPEIRNADLLALALNLKLWGTECETLNWIESPNLLAIHSANRQLQSMGLVNEQEKVTELAKQVAMLGTHPRVATFLVTQSQSRTLTELDWLIALSLHFETIIDTKVKDDETILREFSAQFSRNPQWQKQIKRWRAQLEPQKYHELNFNFKPSWRDQLIEASHIGVALAVAYPERIGFRQSTGRYKLNSAMSVSGNFLNLTSSEKKPSEWAVFPWIRSTGGDFKNVEYQGVGFELALSHEQIRALSQMEEKIIYKNGAWNLQTQWQMGGCLIDQVTRLLDHSELKSHLLPHFFERISTNGLSQSLPILALQLLHRARIALKLEFIQAPNLELPQVINSAELAQWLEEDFLIKHLDIWLMPFVRQDVSFEELPWVLALEYYLGFGHCEKIKQYLPMEVALPSGRLARVDYTLSTTGECGAEIFGKLQEFFGSNGIRIAQGKIPLKIHLLSPNGSPLAITQDLASFWANAYPEVRKEMRGRYPRHPWPENPSEHLATTLTKRALAKRESDQNT